MSVFMAFDVLKMHSGGSGKGGYVTNDQILPGQHQAPFPARREKLQQNLSLHAGPDMFR